MTFVWLYPRRIMEVFTQDWSLSSKLRMPVISRLQKVHNVDIALQVLREKGVDLRDEHGTFELLLVHPLKFWSWYHVSVSIK